MEQDRSGVHYTVQEYENLVRLLLAMANLDTLGTDLQNNIDPDLAEGVALVLDSHLARIHMVAALDEGKETVQVAT